MMQVQDDPRAIARARIAYHEAGRIVVHHRLGGETNAGRIAVLLAGAQVEAMACARRRWPLDERDLLAPGGEDWASIERLLAGLHGRARSDLLSQSTQQAVGILKAEWAKVEEVMSVLYRCRPLCSLEVALILTHHR
jgi:hypothetical protein